MLILSQDTQEKIAQKLLLRIVDVSLTRSFALFHSLELAGSLTVIRSIGPWIFADFARSC